MKSTMRYSALLAALVMALGCIEMLRPSSAAAFEDVELIQPPGEKGDPDTGGTIRVLISKRSGWRSGMWRFVINQPMFSNLSQTTNVRAPANSQIRHVRTSRR